MPPADLALAGKLVSNGAKALIEHGFGDSLQADQTPELIQEFLDDYKDHVCQQSYVYEGMDEVILECEQNNILWGIITNKPLNLARDLIEGLGLLQRAAILLGGDSLPVKKPDPVPMLHSCMVLNLAPSECLYVGDHERDIQAGNAAGMDTAAALWGYIADHEDPSSWDANYLLQKPSGLLTLLQEKL